MFMTVLNKTVHGFLVIGLLVWASITLAQTESAPHRLLVMGDSLSAAHNIPIEQGWVNLLQHRLDEDWQVINASISGETTAGGLNRLTALLSEHQPHWVMISLGANDGLRALSTKMMEENLEQMIDLSITSGAQVLLIGMQIPDNYGPIYQQRFGEVFPKLAQKKQLPFVPFLLEGVGTKPELMQMDGLHPTAEAQLKVLENVWPVLIAETPIVAAAE